MGFWCDFLLYPYEIIKNNANYWEYCYQKNPFDFIVTAEITFYYIDNKPNRNSRKNKNY